MLKKLSQAPSPFKTLAVVCLSYFLFAMQQPTRCQTESKHGMAVSPLLLLLKHVQVILDDDSFAGETMKCMNQMFSQRLKTIAWQQMGAGKH